MTYRPEIDGMRAVAVGIVILFHAGFATFSGGFIGVDVFFVISGYLITRIIDGELREGRFSIARFYERRARRILPALFLVMAAIIPAAFLIMLPSEREALSEGMVATTLFSSNILFWLRSSYFDTAAELNALLHTWSLAVEEQFYIIFPLILMAFARVSRQVLVGLIAVLCAVSLVAAELYSRTHPDAAFYLIPFRAWELGAGALVALTFGSRQIKQAWLGGPLAMLGIAMIAAASVLYDLGTPFPGIYAIPPVLGTCLIIIGARPETLVGRLLSLKPLVGLGLISYSAYLWHQPLFVFARLSQYHELDLWMIWSLIGATLVLAWLSWKFVETPFRNGKRFTVRRLAATLTPVAALLFAFGVAGNFTKGFIGENTYIQASSTLFYDLHTARLDAIGSGTCHFNERGENETIDAFLENWRCGPDAAFDEATGNAGEGRANRPVIAVFGDSVAADLATALRLNGVSTVQLTGAGCSLVPRLQSPDCRALHAAFLAFLETASMDEIWVTNWFEREELNETDFLAAIAPIAASGVPVRILSPLPNYGAVQRAYLTKSVSGDWPKGLRREYRAEDMLALARSVDLPAHVIVTDTRPLFCSLTDDCHLADGEDLLVLDPKSHLSELGLNRYGAVLRAEIIAPLAGPDSADRDFRSDAG